MNAFLDRKNEIDEEKQRIQADMERLEEMKKTWKDDFIRTVAGALLDEISRNLFREVAASAIKSAWVARKKIIR